MHKSFGLTASTVLALVATGPLMAQNADTGGSLSTGALEEVVVTAERRTEDLQKVPASVDVREGTDLADQGRISTTQILEDVPNVTVGFIQPGQSADNPNGNIAIRGVQSTQQTGGRPGPSSTAVYVDDVYQGIGGDYDLSQVEVLRGPQGTLYGRSATGGVVAFHTNDPVLDKFGTDVYGEYGTADLRNGTIAINLPLGDELAVRIAAHEDDRHGFWWNADGDSTSIQEARIKVLYQPLENLRILVSASSALYSSFAGGEQQATTSTGAINYTAGSTKVAPIAGDQYTQYMATASYDFGAANLTYVGSMHTFYQSGFEGIVGPPFMPINTIGGSSPDQFNSQELRLASDPGGKLSWIVGANFYSNIYRATQTSIVQYASECGPCGITDPTPGVDGGEIFSNGFQGDLKDYALFTEETYSVADNLRLTAGLRFDRQEQSQLTFYDFNVNYDQYGQNVGTCSNLEAVSGTPQPCVYSAKNANANYSNITYKVRGEFDLTPTNMLYAMISTGYLPGDAQLSPDPQANGSVTFNSLNFNQERLTSFEVGSKNRLFNNTLQLNGAAFYYDYSGFQQAALTGQTPSGAPIFEITAVPVRMIGLDFDATWQLTSADRVILNGGVVDAQITSYPNIVLNGVVTSESTLLAFGRLAGIPSATANLIYTHTFTFGNGSLLTPRAEARYVAGGNSVELTQAQDMSGDGGACGPGQNTSCGGYDYHSDYTVVNLGLGWLSPKGTYGLTAYARNIGDTISVAGLNINHGNAQAYPTDPRTYGVSFRARF
ncbi:MAG: TonB-dependent receptor [Steroidobacteraceae bacterium]|jgi:outer membrane receptor protein involved in Fe transport